MKPNSYELIHQSFTLELLKEKVVWIKELKSVFIADLHFGKATHFRKSGIPVPELIHDIDLKLIHTLILEYAPEQIYFLGDLFHSDWNDQWTVLIEFIHLFPTVQFHLVKGNHDILHPEFYANSACLIHDKPIELESFLLSHEPAEIIKEGQLNLCGHIHPGIRMKGKGRQSLRLPCFFLSKNQLILPAFGNFTGLALVHPKSGDKVFGITPDRVLSILS